MPDKPLISVIMPCNRPEDVNRAVDIYFSQDWQNKRLIIIGDGVVTTFGGERIFWTRYPHPGTEVMTVGAKRNYACVMAQSESEIICHFDSDDYYAPDYLSRTYSHLIESKADCTGLSSAYFYRPRAELWLYQYQGHQAYCIGSGMMYYRRVWENNPFKDLSEGEDAKFCANAGRVVPHNYIDGFLAMVHGKNTASHKQLSHMKRVDPQIAQKILGEDWDKY